MARKLAKKGIVELSILREATSFRSEDKKVDLHEAQARAVAAIEGAIGGGFKPFLLHGVTGSGKTEVYMRAIEAALEAGKSALLLVPEIGLTPAVASQFFLRFGDRVAILHSAFTGMAALRTVAAYPLGRSTGRDRHAFGRLRTGRRSWDW